MRYREAKMTDLNEIIDLAMKLWPENEMKELRDEFKEIMTSEKERVFVVEDSRIIGFCHIALRFEYVEGCSSSPTGYLEGIFVEGSHRKQGVAKKLVNLGIEWSRENGCNQFASDVELGNVDSQSFHQAIGFDEVNRLVAYIKQI